MLLVSLHKKKKKKDLFFITLRVWVTKVPCCFRPCDTNFPLIPLLFLHRCHGRLSTETSASSSFRLEQMVKIRPSVSAWENIKAAPAPWSGRLRRAMCQPRPREWSASFRSSSGELCDIPQKGVNKKNWTPITALNFSGIYTHAASVGVNFTCLDLLC